MCDHAIQRGTAPDPEPGDAEPSRASEPSPGIADFRHFPAARRAYALVPFMDWCSRAEV